MTELKESQKVCDKLERIYYHCVKLLNELAKMGKVNSYTLCGIYSMKIKK